MSVAPEYAVTAPPLPASGRSVLVIFNPTAGRRRRQRLQRALDRLAALGVTAAVRETGAAGDAQAFAAAVEGVDMVAVAGGDGTINEAANGLAGRADAPALAIILLGTANVLAAELGYRDMAPEAAAGILAGGEAQPAYVGVANGRIFCQMAGVGFDAHVVAGVDAALKRRFGKLAYVWETLRQLWHYRPCRYEVTIDGVRHVAASAVIANGHYYAGRYTCAPAASVDAPTLSVCLFGRAGRWHAIRYAVGLVVGRLHRFGDIKIVAGRHIRIAALDDNGREPVQGDGDIITELPAEIAVAPQCLAIVRPGASD